MFQKLTLKTTTVFLKFLKMVEKKLTEQHLKNLPQETLQLLVQYVTLHLGNIKKAIVNYVVTLNNKNR